MKPATHDAAPAEPGHHAGLAAFLAFLIGMTLSCPAQAGTGVRTSGGPFGGDVRVLAVSPTSPAVVYAGTFQGVFRSTDSGGAWAR